MKQSNQTLTKTHRNNYTKNSLKKIHIYYNA